MVLVHVPMLTSAPLTSRSARRTGRSALRCMSPAPHDEDMTQPRSKSITTPIRPRTLSAVVGGGAVALILVLSGCGAGTTDGTASAAGYNRSDVQFAQAMIPRQRQAAQMSALARTHASDPAVVALAARIRGAQGSWTDAMTGCLTRWGRSGPSGMMSRFDDNEMMGSDSNGMMSRANLHGLASRHGAGFDRMFLRMMVRHHRATIALAKHEGTKGTSPDARKVAAKVQMMQGPELKEMRRLMQP